MTPQSLGFAASLTCSGIFFVFAAVLAVTRRSPLPRELPAMSDLGPQTPAVANLLANGGDVTPDAVPATLLDLQDQLTATEDGLAHARQFYNDAVFAYNTAIQTLPAGILAAALGFKPRQFFQARGAEGATPRVRT